MVEGIGETIGVAIKGVLVGLGIATGVGLVAMIVSSSEPLVVMVGAIVKLLALLLKPIGDIAMVLLYPILLLLKPIVTMVRTLFMPFLQLALNLMSEGAKKTREGDLEGGAKLMYLATADIFSGISFIISNLVYESIQLTGAMLLKALLFLIGVIFPPIKDKIPSIMKLYNTTMDGFHGVYISAQLNAIKAVHDTLKVDMGNFFNKTITNANEYLLGTNPISGNFKDDLLGFTDKVDEAFKEILDMEDTAVPGGKMKNYAKQMGEVGATAVKKVVTTAKDLAFEELSNLVTPSEYFKDQDTTREVTLNKGV